MLKYMELKTGFSDNGPAWIARVTCSRSGQTIYFNGRALKKIDGGGIKGNFRDIETGEEFWVSGVKKNGQDRYRAGLGKLLIEATAVSEYLAYVGVDVLDRTRFEIIDALIPTDIERFKHLENFKRSDWPFEDENV